MIWLKIIARRQLGHCSGIPEAIAECDELIAIFVSSTRTAMKMPSETSKINIQQSSFVNQIAERVASEGQSSAPSCTKLAHMGGTHCLPSQAGSLFSYQRL
jgi:hypothetical protein